MEGRFIDHSVPVRWIVAEDEENGEEGGSDWVLEVQIVDISISRRYRIKISQIEAEREARAVVPMLLQIASAWLK